MVIVGTYYILYKKPLQSYLNPRTNGVGFLIYSRIDLKLMSKQGVIFKSDSFYKIKNKPQGYFVKVNLTSITSYILWLGCKVLWMIYPLDGSLHVRRARAPPRARRRHATCLRRPLPRVWMGRASYCSSIRWPITLLCLLSARLCTLDPTFSILNRLSLIRVALLRLTSQNNPNPV